MAIQLAVVLPFALSIGKDILEIPMVHRAIENYFAKTPTLWDGLVWRLFEKWAKITSPAEDKQASLVLPGVGLKSDLDVLQSKYTETRDILAANPGTTTLLAAAGQAGVFGARVPWTDETAVA